MPDTTLTTLKSSIDNLLLNAAPPAPTDETELLSLKAGLDGLLLEEPIKKVNEIDLAEQVFQKSVDDTTPLLKEVRGLIAREFQKGHSHAGPVLQALDSAGLEGAAQMVDPTYHNQIRNDGLSLYNSIAKRNGWHDLQGPGVEQAKNEIAGGLVVREFLYNQPIHGLERRRVVGANVRDLIKKRVNEIITHAQETGLTAETIEQQNRLTAVAHKLSALSDDQLEQTWRNMVWLANEKPSNPVEESIFSERDLKWGSTPFKKGQALATMGIGLEMERTKPWQVGIMNKIMGIADPPLNESARTMHPKVTLELFQELFGKDASKIVYRRVKDGMANYVARKSGLIVATPPGGAGPMQLLPLVDSTGVDPLLLAPRGALKTLLTAQVENDPQIRKTVLATAYREGPAAAREVVAETVLQAQKDVRKQLRMIDDELMRNMTGLTPAEAVKQGTAGQLLATAFDGIVEGLTTIHDSVDHLEETMAQGSPWFSHLSRDIASAYTGDFEHKMTAAVRTPLEAAHVIFKTAIDRGDYFRMFADGLALLGAKPKVGIGDLEAGPSPGRLHMDRPVAKIFEKAGPEFRRQLLLETNNAMENYNQYHENSLALWDRYNQELYRDAGKIEKLPANLAKLAVCSGLAVYHGIFQNFPLWVDDPKLGVSCMLGGAVMAGGAGAIAKQTSPMFQRVMHSHRLNLDMRQIAKFYPEKIEPIRHKMWKVLSDAVKDPDSPVATINKLSELEGAVAAMRENWVRTGVLGVKGFAKIMAEAWPHIKGEMGLLGYNLGSKTIKRSWLAKVVEPFNRVVGRDPGKSNKYISLFVNEYEKGAPLDSGANMAAEAIQEIFGSKATAKHLENKISEFIHVNSRRPSGSELVDMLPDDVQPLYGMLMAAEKGAVRQPIWSAVNRIFGRQNMQEIVKDLFQNAEQTLNQWVDDGIELLHNVHELGIKKQRNDLFISAARHRAEHLADTLELNADAIRRIRMHQNLPEDQLARLKAEVDDLMDAAKIHRDNSKKFDEIRVRMHQHGAQTGPWKPPRGMGLDEYITDDMIEMLVENNRELFSGFVPEALYKTVRRPHPKPVLDEHLGKVHEAAKNVRSLGRRLKKIEKDPAKADERLAGMRKQLKELEDAHAEATKNPPPTTDEVVADGQMLTKPPTPDEQFGPGIEALKKQIGEREAALQAGDIYPDTYENTRGAFLEAKEKHMGLQTTFRRMKKEGIPERKPNPEGHQAFRQMLEYEGPVGSFKERLDIKDQLVKHIRADRYLDIHQGNPFSSQTLPIMAKGKAMRDTLLALKNRMMSIGAWVDDLTQIEDKMSPRERDILGQFQLAGERPTSLMKKHPKLKKIYDSFEGLPGDEQENITWFLEQEEKLSDEFFKLGIETGRFPKKVAEAWREQLYDPNIHRAFERPHLIMEKEGRRAIAAIKGQQANTKTIPVHEQNDRFMFTRSRTKWRLRVEEPDQIRDLKFDSKKEAQQYILEHYDKEMLDQTKLTQGVIEGETPYGDPYTLGAPLGQDLLKALDTDFAAGTVSKRRLVRLSQGFRDIFLDNMMRVLNGYGDQVLTPEQFAKIKATGSNRLIGKYVFVPNNPKSFGPIAGKYVQRGAIGELNRTLSTWDNMSAALEGIREAFSTYTGRLPEEILEKTPGRLARSVDWISRAARSNLVLMSIKARVVQPMFNFISDHLMGSRTFRAENAENLKIAMGETGQKGLFMRKDSLYFDARDENILTGFYANRSVAMRQAMAKLSGLLEPKEDVRKLLRRREAVLKELNEGKLKGIPKETAVQMEADLAAIQSGLREAEKGTIKRMFRWLVGTMVDPQSNLGLPTNKFGTWLRETFSWWDEWFKYASYRNLRQQGLPKKVAAHQVKLFSQNYAEIPHYIRSIPKAAQSLIVSFPYEAIRIAKNGTMFAPSRFLGIMSVVPAFNFLQMARTGTDWKRINAIMEQRGRHDMYEKGWYFASTFMGLDMDREMDWSIDISNAIPFGDLTMGYGVLKEMYDNWNPPEHRGWLGSLGRGAVGVVSNFIGNRPLYNWAGMSYSGKDEFTGQPLFDPKAGAMECTLGYLKLLGKNMLPPAAPYGRDWMAIQDALAGGVSTLTGKRKKPTVLEAGLRAFTGLDVRGSANLLGLGSGDKRDPLVSDEDLFVSTMYRVKTRPEFGGYTFEQAMESDWRELKELMGRQMDEALSPKERAQAAHDFAEVIGREYKVEMDGITATLGKTERQIQMTKNRMKNDGIIERFKAEPLDVQAMTLSLLDQYSIDPDLMLAGVTAVQWTDQASIDRERDPGKVRRALEILRLRTAAPGHSPHLDVLERHLQEKTLPIAEASFKKESLLRDVKNEQTRRVREALIKRAK